MKKNLLLLAIFVIHIIVFAESMPPKREFRAVWVATVENLDWPTRGASPQTQKQELINLLDAMKAAGINAILFQVRPECDALYASTIEPWSYWLTGSQGGTPSPFYDPLAYAVEEAHKRGMELHAWFNPYRAVRTVGSYAAANDHVSVTHPDWILHFTKIRMKLLDPGRPDVREHVTKVVMDVVERYEIDGVHFDDYFYPYANSSVGFYGITGEDDHTFAAYNRGFTDKADWRRDNVNLLVKMVYDAIQGSKPWVKFGISPFGIWKAGNPPGISGTSAYDAIYCDAPAWLNARTVDYLTPQLYWRIGGGQDYAKLMPWWAGKMNGLHFHPGHAAYRIGEWTAGELPGQVRLDRANEVCSGSVFFRAKNIRDNLKGFTDSLKADYYRYKAVQPVMTWKNDIAPLPPNSLRYRRLDADESLQLHWSAPAAAADGDSARRYLIYRHTLPAPTAADLADPGSILDISYRTHFAPPIPTVVGPHYYTVTALDHYGNESSPGETIAVSPPDIPLLASPLPDESGLGEAVTLRWRTMATAAAFEVQAATTADFTAPLFVRQAGIADTFYTVAGLYGQTRYHWRVRAGNAGGWGDFSESRSFVPGSPTAPLLAFPGNNQLNVPVSTPLAWHPADGAGQYRLQLSRNLNFDPSGIVLDKAQVADTFFVADNLDLNRIYFWRVRAANQLGTSVWSSVFRFKTTAVTVVAEAPIPPVTMELGQNYPNPFNDLTVIPFQIPADGHVRIYIYDMLGRRVLTLADAILPAGSHEVSFDAGDFATGVYVYRLFYQGNILSKRMLYVR